MKKNKQETTKQYFKLKGYALFPKVEDDRFNICLALTEDRAEKIYELCEKANSELDAIKLSDVEFNNETYKGLNVHTSFEIPIYDKEGHLLGDDVYEIYHGAEVLIKGCISEYTFKKTTGLTAYLQGATVIKQGKKQGVAFEDLVEDEEFDDIPF